MARRRTCSLTGLGVISAAILVACGGGNNNGTSASRESSMGASPLPVPKVVNCRPGDRPESALQGQVPAALRQKGFEGFNCNLSLVGQYQGEGGNWSHATFTDRNDKTCAYHSTGTPTPDRQTPGVPVIDITDPANPVRTTSLTTPAMLDPWESLRINARREILIGDNGSNSSQGGAEIDVYDVGHDCSSPQLLASVPVGTGTDGGLKLPNAPKGHEGNISPDGLTYYIGDLVNKSYHAVDITNPRQPKLIATWDVNSLGLKPGTTVHGLSVSEDGNRVYAVVLGFPTAQDVANPKAPLNNGFVVLDTSEVQARKPGATLKPISTVLFKDGSVAQHTIPIKINGKPYVVMVDEAGSGGLADPENNYIKNACAAGLMPFPVARLYDISDETKPKVVSKLMLETHDCKNQSQVEPDTAGLAIFTYGSHYCSVDNRENATALACSYFNSGIRVFDIRNPHRPKEIAYYNPKAAPAVPGSNHVMFRQWRAGGPDWCAARLDFDFKKKQLVTMCQDNGVLVMEFAPNTWPFKESTPSTNQS